MGSFSDEGLLQFLIIDHYLELHDRLFRLWELKNELNNSLHLNFSELTLKLGLCLRAVDRAWVIRDEVHQDMWEPHLERAQTFFVNRNSSWCDFSLNLLLYKLMTGFLSQSPLAEVVDCLEVLLQLSEVLHLSRLHKNGKTCKLDQVSSAQDT